MAPLQKTLYALNSFDDFLYVFRCLAVHRGAHKQHNLPKTRELAKEFFSIYEIPNETVEMEHLPLVASYFRQDIAVFGVSDECVFTLWGHFRPEFAEEEEKTEPMMTGVYRGHAFLIKDLEKVTKLFECAHCNARFTKSCDLSRQAERCTDGPAKIICPWNKVWAPKYFYERAFHPRGKYGRAACYLFEAESKRSGIHIHYQLCGHGSERLIAGHPVDGYHHEKSNSLSVP